jgi:hypothetical protein
MVPPAPADPDDRELQDGVKQPIAAATTDSRLTDRLGFPMAASWLLIEGPVSHAPLIPPNAARARAREELTVL